MQMHSKIIVAGLGLAFMCGMAFAAPQAAEKANKSDVTFAKKAAEGGNAEVKMGQLAQDKGESIAVKEFGKRMEQDHTQAGEKLKDLAGKENIDLPTGMNTSDQQVYDRLSKLSGQAFDIAYMRDMVKDHTADISEFQQEAKNGTDEKLKSFASDTLPTLQDHLKQAQQIRASQGGKNVKSAQKEESQ